ncbi:damage-control phosphatase ARMT1 family protein [Vallitalea maricola]|uniref:ARMT1-like domain-containing protein n=1 Tax=Vallitalea maricola TaxID=3074433 RepID=A0ACB5UKH8_9FIRM|nr:ARMT1-like domain-containing protein [Vallitalea sp. AN17-2]
MYSHVDCIACIINKANKLADKYIEDKKEKYKFMNKVLLEVADTEYEKTAPYISTKVMRILHNLTGVDDFYKEEKKLFNEKLLAMEDNIKAMLDDSAHRFLDAIRIAMAGNIVDFGALDNITMELVEEIIKRTMESKIDKEVYNKFYKELSNAKEILYLGDNTGEIVFDKILMEEIKKEFPDITIYFATRGKPALNDANEEDAYFVGIDKHAKIINNGTDIPGTDLDEVSDEFKEVFYNKADMIISKGQGNFETLSGSGHNIFYLFLCKCDMITKRLKIDKLSAMFLYEKDIDKTLF